MKKAKTKKLKEQWIGITLGAEYGGPDVATGVEIERIRLNKILDKYCAEPYSKEVTCIALFLRVEGRLKSYGFAGIDSVERLKPQRAIGADISIERKDWDTDPASFRRFLWPLVDKGIWVCVKTLISQRVLVDEMRLKADLNMVKVEFFDTD